MEKIINDWLKLRSYLVILPSPTSFLDFFNLLIIKIHIKVTPLGKTSGGGGEYTVHLSVCQFVSGSELHDNNITYRLSMSGQLLSAMILFLWPVKCRFFKLENVLDGHWWIYLYPIVWCEISMKVLGSYVTHFLKPPTMPPNTPRIPTAGALSMYDYTFRWWPVLERRHLGLGCNLKSQNVLFFIY